MGKKSESIAIRSPPYRHPFFDRYLTGKYWLYSKTVVDGHAVKYSLGRDRKWLDKQVAQSIIAIAIGHDANEIDADEFCDRISTTWENARNFVDFLGTFDFSEDEKEKIFTELWKYYTGVLDLDEISVLHLRRLKRLKNDPNMKVVGHFLYTLEPPTSIRSNYEIFGIHTKFQGINSL
jgi:hypothetical protein